VRVRLYNTETIMFYCSYFRLSFYGQLLEQLQCCLTVRPCCLYSVLFFLLLTLGKIYDDDDNDDDEDL